MIKKIIEYLKEEQKNNKTEYDKIVLVEQAYNNGNMEQVVSYFFEKFGQNIRAILNFCMQKGIIPDCSSEKEEQFIDVFSKLRLSSVTSRKISSLDDIMLVRRCDFLPKGDIIEPSIKSFMKDYEGNAQIDGQIRKYEYAYLSNSVHTTIHFTLNQEVQPHVSAPEGWKKKKFTILQPMTEELYKSAIMFEPMDTFYFGDVKLDNYIVICDSLESAKELITNNKSATPIIVGKDKVAGFGNKIIQCMGITCPYVSYNGARHDWNIPIKNYYTDEFIKNYPRFVSDVKDAENNPFHELGKEIRIVSNIIESTDRILQLIGTNHSFEETINIVMENTNVSEFLNVAMVQEILNEYGLPSSILPDRYKDYENFLNYLVRNANFNTDKIDIQTIFEKMCEGLVIDQTNITQFKKIKEIVINIINNYNKLKFSIDKEKKLPILRAKLLALSKIMRTDAMKLPVKEAEMYNVPIEWYDLSDIEEQTKEHLAQYLQSGKSFYDSVYELVQNPQIIRPNFPLQKPKSTVLARAEKLCEAKIEFDSSPLLWTLIDELSRVIPSNGQHVTEDDIKNINYTARLVTLIETLIENERTIEFDESHSKHR